MKNRPNLKHSRKTFQAKGLTSVSICT